MSHFITSQTHTTNNTTFIGMADVLPTKKLRDLCSCADLFFARVLDVCAGGDLYHVEVAALSHYFEAAPQTRTWHVQTLFLTQQQVAQLLEWDRRLAALPTSDVQEIVQAHRQLVLEAQRTPMPFSLLYLLVQFMAHTSTAQTQEEPSKVRETPVRAENRAPAHQHSRIQTSPIVDRDDLADVAYVAGPSVTLTNEIILVLWTKMQHRMQRTYPSIRQFSRFLLQAIYPQLKGNEKKRLAGVRYASGPYAAQVEIVLTYEPGKNGAIKGCIVNTFIPQQVAV